MDWDEWFYCYEANGKGRIWKQVVCYGPFQTATEADSRFKNFRENSTLLEVNKYLPDWIKTKVLERKYNKLFAASLFVLPVPSQISKEIFTCDWKL